jgi:hypothetical protein
VNYPLEEVDGLLAKLADERNRVPDDTGREVDGKTMVVPNAMPSRQLDADLEGKGVTSTIAVAWPPRRSRVRLARREERRDGGVRRRTLLRAPMPLDPTIATTLEHMQTREVRRRDLVAASLNVRSRGV